MKNWPLIIFVIILIALYATNPTKTDFKEYASDYVNSEIKNAGIKSDNFVDSFIKVIAGQAVSSAVDLSVKRDDYYLFSIYSIEGFNVDYKFLGVFRKFIPIRNDINVSAINLRFPDPKTLIDKEIKVEEDHYSYYEIKIDKPSELTISADVISGPKVDLIFLDKNGLSGLKKRMNGDFNAEVRYYPELSGDGIYNINKTSTISSGTYYLVIDNTDLGGTIPPMNFENDTCAIKIKVSLKPI